MPKGEIPKDGPSGGLAITSSLVSLALKKPLKPGFAMTGEISLKGKVGIIGGVKDKILGGKRSGISNFIFPEENKEDTDELSEFVTDGINLHFVKEYKEAHQILFTE
jgi:ATP-dependent Lon protease